METLLDKTIFSVIDPPNLRINLPRWFTFPSPMQTFFFILLTYFLVSGGIVYDVINEPPSIGSTVDERGNSRPVAIMPYRVNGQYIMEGLVASLMFCLGGYAKIGKFKVRWRCKKPFVPPNAAALALLAGDGVPYYAHNPRAVHRRESSVSCRATTPRALTTTTTTAFCANANRTTAMAIVEEGEAKEKSMSQILWGK
ncbi:hypothetical protein niasHT_014048 [Heterodera trifolii]|uniref:Oligosaccharyltransferase complex subunit n=1 Tax=Heterodera trifolii TaxID=157864 RepID=A0ABD2LIK3_9BILA